MATLTLRLDTRNKKAKAFPVVMQLTHKGVPKRIPTGLKILESEWDDKDKKVKNSYDNSTRVNKQLYNKLSIAQDTISRYAFHLKGMTVYDLAEAISHKLADNADQQSFEPSFAVRTTLAEYGEKVKTIHRKANQFSTLSKVTWAINEVIKYHGNNRLLITDIDEVFILGFEADCKSREFSTSSIAMIMSNIRRIYNLAIKDKKTEVTREHYPFGQNGYSLKMGQGKKRAINVSYIKTISELPYPEGTSFWHSKNYLLFMFYLRGMNFADLAYLTRDNLLGGRLSYKRRKTKRGAKVKTFNFSIPPEAQIILDYYLKEERPGNLIFPVLEQVIENPDQEVIYKKYDSKLSGFNRHLKKIGEDAKTPIPLSSYVIRHTFATAGLHKGLSKAIIGDMLGHTDYATTEAYFSDFEQEVMDDAANVIFG